MNHPIAMQVSQTLTHHLGGSMKTTTSVRLLTLCCIVLVAASLLPPKLKSQNQRKSGNLPAKEVYTGTAVAVGGQFGGASRPFTLEITGYATNEEVQRDFEVLRSQGQDDFMKTIKDKKLGFFAFDGQVGRDLNFILETQTENGRKITILFERWLQMFEVRYGTRSQDYPFAYIELFINDNGKGEGSLIGLAKVSFDKKNPNNLDIENFGTYPAKLMGVELRSQ
jgi:hypothetical protein